jgi:hypothetical protein
MFLWPSRDGHQLYLSASPVISGHSDRRLLRRRLDELRARRDEAIFMETAARDGLFAAGCASMSPTLLLWNTRP